MAANTVAFDIRGTWLGYLRCVAYSNRDIVFSRRFDKMVDSSLNLKLSMKFDGAKALTEFFKYARNVDRIKHIKLRLLRFFLFQGGYLSKRF